MIARTPAGDGSRSRWIPYAFVAFFGIVLAANAAMIWIAVSTWTGLETENAYRKGLAYNRTIEQARAQAALGWRVDLAFAQQDDRTLAIELALADRNGDLIETASVNAAFMRPTHEGHDRTIPVPHRYGGQYLGEVRLPLAGQWDVRVAVEARGEVWRARRRVYLRP